MKALGVLVLRYQRHDQEYKMPFNLKAGKIEIPFGLGATTLLLFLVGISLPVRTQYSLIQSLQPGTV